MHVRLVVGNRNEAERRHLPLVLLANFGDGDVEAFAQARNQRLQDAALAFQIVILGDRQLQSAKPHDRRHARDCSIQSYSLPRYIEYTIIDSANRRTTLSENEYTPPVVVATAEAPLVSPENPIEPNLADAGTLPPLTPPATQGSGNARTFIRETLETIALTLIIFVVIRAGVQNFRIEGFSMEPNFHDGEYLLVSKIDYVLHAPERGDVVVFQAPTARDRDFIKRIIGLPGETVEVREGRVFINGSELSQTYNVNPATYNYGPAVAAPTSCLCWSITAITPATRTRGACSLSAI